MCWQNCTSCGHKPTGFICRGAGTESDSGKMLRVLPHLLNQAVLRNTTHPSHYTQFYWADLWSLDLRIWNEATITFLPSFQGPALPLREVERPGSGIVPEEDVNRRVNAYLASYLVLLSSLCPLRRPGSLLGILPGLWQLPNQSASSCTLPVNSGGLCILIPVYSEASDGSVTSAPKIKPKCSHLTIIYQMPTPLKVSYPRT